MVLHSERRKQRVEANINSGIEGLTQIMQGTAVILRD